MSARLTIVIPTLNCAQVLPPLLTQVFDGVAAGLVARVVISDGGSSDHIARIAEETGAELVTGPPGRGGQLARGAKAARGDWLLFLHADSRLPDGWSDIAAAHITAGRGPAAFRLKFDSTSPGARWTAGWANLRSRLFNLPYGDQGLLISGRDYRKAGGYDDIPLMEDVALNRRLDRITLLPAAITTSSDRYDRRGWFAQGARNFLTLARYLTGADPATLARHYER